MKSISRRSFVALSTGAIVADGSLCATGLPLSDERRSLQPNDGMFLVEHLRPDGGWEPSARLLPPSELRSCPARAADGRWYLTSGERVSFLRPDVEVKVERRKVARKSVPVGSA